MSATVESVKTEAENVMNVFNKKNRDEFKKACDEFKKLEKEIEKLSDNDKLELDKLFITNAYACCHKFDDETYYPIDKHMIKGAEFWQSMQSSEVANNSETLNLSTNMDEAIGKMKNSTSDSIDDWHKRSMIIWGAATAYLVYSLIEHSFEIPLLIMIVASTISFVLSFLYKSVSSVPGYIAIRRSMDKRNLEKLYVFMVNLLGVTKNMPSMMVITKVNGMEVSRHRDISFEALKMIGPVANLAVMPGMLPFVTVHKFMTKNFKYEYHYHQSEHLNFNIPYRIFRFFKELISGQ